MSYIGTVSRPAVNNIIPDNSITAAKIVDGAIVAADLAENSVGTSELDIANITGVLPAAVTGGSGLTALGTVTSGTIGSGVTMPAHSVIQMLESDNQSNYVASNSTGGQAGLYGFPTQRVYVDINSITFTPKSATSKFIIMSSVGMNSMTVASTGAWGTALVKDNTTGYQSSTYPYYPASNTVWTYGPDISYTWVVASTSTSSVTFYLKGYAYGEGGSGTQTFSSNCSQLTILEIAT